MAVTEVPAGADPTLPPVPSDLVIRRRTRTPVRDAELTADHPVTLPLVGELRHRLVVLGDSLSHGFKSLAIADTGLSWPALVAEVLGLQGDEFRFPSYPGPEGCPGLPLNLEALLRILEQRAGDAPLVGARSPVTVAAAVRVLEQVKDYWEDDQAPPVPTDRYMHNLAIYGWDVRDALSKSAGWCADKVLPLQGWQRHLPHLPHLLVANDGPRAALRVLAGPSGREVTQVSAAQALGAEGVETLVVALGANNALSSVLKMQLIWTDEHYLEWDAAQRLEGKDAATVTRPSHFAADYAELVTELEGVNARHVVLLTVPHVTVAPLLHGFGDKPHGSRYFARYGRVWASEQDFNPDTDECLSGEACRQIDSAIDAYNDTIVGHVRSARSRGLDWHVVDLCAVLDSLAYRRYYEDISARPADYEPYQLPDALAELSPRPDTRFFGSDSHGRRQGGLTALDGVHPTTIGYGIVAHEVLKVLVAAGAAPAASAVDFQRLVGRDTLIGNPPRTLSTDLALLGLLVEHLDIMRSLLRH